jgi:ATP-dependent DNA helicase UvrD/PcrA
MRLSYLDRLNPEQRQAVEHGVGEVNGLSNRPLLVIAGAGSGKTSTLAHRVAHLIVNGADPRRILLMTFSRRAAAEMTRRAERILRSATGQGAAGTADRLGWAGTFHAIGARLLRAYANEIGVDPGFTIHDREDSADLLNLVRHQLGFSKTPARFPMKGTCLAIYSRRVNASIMSSSMSIRTRTACRRRSCWPSSPAARASPSSATTRSRSIRFAARRCATSSISRDGSARPPRS